MTDIVLKWGLRSSFAALSVAATISAAPSKPVKPGSLPSDDGDAKIAPKAQIGQFWYGLSADDTTSFRLVTDFSLKQIAPDRNYSHQVSARMTLVHPATDKKSDLKITYTNDTDLVQQSLKLASRPPASFPLQSAEYRWNVARPGSDVLYLRPKKEIFLSDRNRIFSVYVRGAQHAHQVFAVFRGPNKIQQEIFVCSLDFSGWKRFEVVIPPYLRLRNPLKHNRFELYFNGLKIQSHFRDQPGMSVFNFAEMFIMADTSDNKIPGADMKDDF